MRSRPIIVMVAFLLICSFGLHAVSIDHHHPWASADSIQATLHGEEKKWFANILYILCIFTGLVAAEWYCRKITSRYITASFEILVLFDPLRKALRKGIMHPKLCA